MSELVKNNQKNFHQICPSEIGLLPYFINFWLENLVKWSKRPIFGRKFDENSFGYFTLILISDDGWRHLVYSEYLKTHFEGSELAGSCKFEHNF